MTLPKPESLDVKRKIAEPYWRDLDVGSWSVVIAAISTKDEGRCNAPGSWVHHVVLRTISEICHPLGRERRKGGYMVVHLVVGLG